MPKIPSDSKRKVSEKFQNRIIAIIDEHYDSNCAFADNLKIDMDVIIRAVNYGIIPSLKILIKIADKQEILVGYLLGETEDEKLNKAVPPTTFHIRLKELKKEKNNVKFSQIGYKVSFPYGYFYDWLRKGTLPSLEYLEQIASYFGVSIDYLLGRTDDRFYSDQKPETKNIE